MQTTVAAKPADNRVSAAGKFAAIHTPIWQSSCLLAGSTFTAVGRLTKSCGRYTENRQRVTATVLSSHRRANNIDASLSVAVHDVFSCFYVFRVQVHVNGMIKFDAPICEPCSALVSPNAFNRIAVYLNNINNVCGSTGSVFIKVSTGISKQGLTVACYRIRALCHITIPTQ